MKLHNSHVSVVIYLSVPKMFKCCLDGFNKGLM